VAELKPAIKEAEIALKYGYHLGLVSLGGLRSYSESELIKHIESISTYHSHIWILPATRP
jgi:hypothetical protein